MAVPVSPVILSRDLSYEHMVKRISNGPYNSKAKDNKVGSILHVKFAVLVLFERI